MTEEDGAIGLVSKFVEVINAGNSKALMKLQSKDFTLIDMDGEKNVGRDGWYDYFSAYPNYTIHIKQILTSGTSVAIIGKTSGSHIESKIEEAETVVWIAEVEDGLVSYWRIYSDLNTA
jgi:hypothetical protein